MIAPGMSVCCEPWGEGVELARQRQLLGVGVRRPAVEREQRLDVLLVVALAVDANHDQRIAGHHLGKDVALDDVHRLPALVGIGPGDVDQHADRLVVTARLAAAQCERSQRQDRERLLHRATSASGMSWSAATS
jgi:hypothetical protein